LNKSDFDDIKNSVEKKEFLIDEDEIFNGPYMKRSSSAPIVNPNVELEDSTIMALNLVEHNDLMNRKRNLSNQSKSKETNSHIESSFTIETILRVDKEPSVCVVNKLKSDHPNSAIPESKKFDMKSYKLKQSLSQKLSSSGTISTNSFNSTTTTNNERNPETSNSKRTRDWVNNVAADGGQDNSDEALSTDRDTGIYSFDDNNSFLECPCKKRCLTKLRNTSNTSNLTNTSTQASIINKEVETQTESAPTKPDNLISFSGGSDQEFVKYFWRKVNLVMKEDEVQKYWDIVMR